VRRLIALQLPHGPELVDELRRVFDAGDAALPVDLRLGEPARRRILEAMRPAAVVEPGGRRRTLAGAEPVEDGDALVMVTSGTTGEPKGVVLTHEAVAASARATNARLGVDPETDRWWACLPFAHIGGLSVVLRAWAAGLPVEVSRFSPEGAELALARGATLTSLVPTALRRLGPARAAAFRRIVLGGQAPPSRLPANVVATYGMTETGSGVVYDGLPLDGVEVAIGVGSEILLRGPMLLRAYRDGTDPKRAGGWLPTGDAGRLDGSGRLQVHGRISDLIISGGENVWPAAVEQVLERHPAVGEVAVAGVPDPEWGERVTAWVVPDPGAPDLPAPALLAELRELVKEEIAGYAAPRSLVLVRSLPRSAIGKVQRAALTGLEGASAAV